MLEFSGDKNDVKIWASPSPQIALLPQFFRGIQLAVEIDPSNVNRYLLFWAKFNKLILFIFWPPQNE